MAEPIGEQRGTEELAAEYYRLTGLIESLERQLDPVTDALLARLKDGDTVDVPKTRRRLRRRSRRVLEADRLEQHADMTTRLWNSITRRVPFEPLMTLAIHKGKLTQKMVNECSRRSRPWIEIMK